MIMKKLNTLAIIIVTALISSACRHENYISPVAVYDPLESTYKMKSVYNMTGFYSPLVGGGIFSISFQDYVSVISRDTIFVNSYSPSQLNNKFYFHHIYHNIKDSTITFLADWPAIQPGCHDTIIYNYSSGKLKHSSITTTTYLATYSQ